MSDFLAKNLPVMRAALNHHNGDCPVPARAFLLNPTDHEKLELAIPELWGLPVCADERVRLGFFRVDCEGSSWCVEDELLAYVQAPEPIPVAVPDVPLEHPLASRAAPELP